MKINLFNEAVSKYSHYTVDELLEALKNIKNTRNKSSILISLAAVEKGVDNSKRFSCLLEEVKNKDNINTTEFAPLTVAMIAAIGILKMQKEQYTELVIHAIHANWSQDSITDFVSILKFEGVVISL